MVTREVYDGYVPNEMLIGQTDKIIARVIMDGYRYLRCRPAPHRHQRTQVPSWRSTKDSEAPIFKVADFGLVGDLLKIIPELEQAL